MKQQSKSLTDDEILNELREIAKQLGKDYISQEEVNDNSELISASTVIYRFGNWPKGIEKAGLQMSPFSKRYSEEEYYENLLNVWTHHGRQPFLREMNEFPSVIGAGGYESRFKSWRKALEAFVQKMNKDSESDTPEKTLEETSKPEEVIREEIKKYSVLSEDRREIKLGLRYKVLSRDRFKCIRCGRSPATDTKCRLHIDHIVPFSKGGRTMGDNLQTLCDACNLGKGNRYSE